MASFLSANSFTNTEKVSIVSRSLIFIVQFGQLFFTDRNFECLFNLKLKVKVNSKCI